MDDSRLREEKSRGSCGGLYSEIDYIDKVPYRVADTRGAVNGKDTGVEKERREKEREIKREKERGGGGFMWMYVPPCACMDRPKVVMGKVSVR